MKKTLMPILAMTLCSVGMTAALATPAAAGTTPQCVTKMSRLDDGAGGANWMPIASNGSTICFLHQGSVSQAVWALQRALRVCYGQNISVDSSFGSNTRNALINVQRSLGISADGGYGRQTRTAMKFSRSDLTEPSASDPRFCHHNGPVT